jgi:hypothetical protein
MPANNLKFISPTMPDVGGACHVRFRLSSTPMGSGDPFLLRHSRKSLAGIHPKERSTLRTPDDLFPHIPSIKKSLFIPLCQRENNPHGVSGDPSELRQDGFPITDVGKDGGDGFSIHSILGDRTIMLNHTSFTWAQMLRQGAQHDNRGRGYPRTCSSNFSMVKYTLIQHRGA